MKELNEVYIGRIIQNKVIERGIGYTEFARRINCARTSLYNIFNSKSIDIERLITISQVLEYDFIREVYLKEKPLTDSTSIQIPFKDGRIDTSNLPESFVNTLKELINKI